MRKVKLRTPDTNKNALTPKDDDDDDEDDDDDYAKQPDNTFKVVCSQIRPLMREFLHTHVTPQHAPRFDKHEFASHDAQYRNRVLDF